MEFIVHARRGVNCKQLNVLLNKIIPTNTVPINYYDADDTQITTFSKPNMLTFSEIADLLNDYNISNRSRPWTSGMVSRINKLHLKLPNRNINTRFEALNL